MRALEREPERRFANVTELSEHLAFAAGISGRGATPTPRARHRRVGAPMSATIAAASATGPASQLGPASRRTAAIPVPCAGSQTPNPRRHDRRALHVVAAGARRRAPRQSQVGRRRRRSSASSLAGAVAGVAVTSVKKKQDTAAANSVGVTQMAAALGQVGRRARPRAPSAPAGIAVPRRSPRRRRRPVRLRGQRRATDAARRREAHGGSKLTGAQARLRSPRPDGRRRCRRRRRWPARARRLRARLRPRRRPTPAVVTAPRRRTASAKKPDEERSRLLTVSVRSRATRASQDRAIGLRWPRLYAPERHEDPSPFAFLSVPARSRDRRLAVLRLDDRTRADVRHARRRPPPAPPTRRA